MISLLTKFKSLLLILKFITMFISNLGIQMQSSDLYLAHMQDMFNCWGLGPTLTPETPMLGAFQCHFSTSAAYQYYVAEQLDEMAEEALVWFNQYVDMIDPRYLVDSDQLESQLEVDATGE